MKRICIAILAAVLVTGCKEEEKQIDKYVGSYIGSVEVTDELLNAIKSSPGMEDRSDSEILEELEAAGFNLNLYDGGKYYADGDTGRWSLNDQAGIIHMSMPARFRLGVLSGFNQEARISTENHDRYMRTVEIRLRVVDGGDTLWFETNDFTVDSMLDITTFDFESGLINMKYVFKLR